MFGNLLKKKNWKGYICYRKKEASEQFVLEGSGLWEWRVVTKYRIEIGVWQQDRMKCKGVRRNILGIYQIKKVVVHMCDFGNVQR